MRHLIRLLVGVCSVVVLLICAAILLTASDPPPLPESADVFGFSDLQTAAPTPDVPALSRYIARDGTYLSYRFYDSPAERILLFVHGSSYHGAAYHRLARHLSEGGIAKVATPNLRGHYMSGSRRGDVDYIGQYEDDVADLVDALRNRGHTGPVTLGGHSSGGGFVIRFANGPRRDVVSSHLLLSPVIPTSPSVKGGNAGGWATLHQRRLFGLLILNALGIDGLNDLPIIAFNKPARYRDGNETLSYSYRLNSSYHPRFDHQSDIEAVEGKAMLLLVGSEDEAIDAHLLEEMFDGDRAGETIEVIPGVDHFGVFNEETPLDRIAEWLQTQ